MLTATNTTDAPAAIGPYSQAIRCGDLLFSSGQIPLNAKSGEIVGSGISSQAEQVMKNIEAILKANGISFDAVIKTTCFLTDMADFAAFNEVYSKYFAADPKPARSTVAVRGLPKGVLCEVELIAKV